MSVVRRCMYIFVFLVNFHLTVGKPFGGFFWCELFCDDDDDISTSTTSTSTEDFYDYFDMCGGCPTRRPSTRRPNNNLPPLNFEIPPNTGLGVTVSNRNGSWFMNLSPFGPRASTIPPGIIATMAATTAAATTAAATTAAATAAGTGATTVASTTAK